MLILRSHESYGRASRNFKEISALNEDTRGSSTLVMGKGDRVAKRPGILARHASVWLGPEDQFVLEGRWQVANARATFPPSRWDGEHLRGRYQTLACLAIIHSRSATEPRHGIVTFSNLEKVRMRGKAASYDQATPKPLSRGHFSFTSPGLPPHPAKLGDARADPKVPLSICWRGPYYTRMSVTAEQVAEVLALPEQDRAYLARQLITSLDGTVDTDAETQWQEVIDRRSQELEEGKVQCRPVEVRDIRHKLHARRQPS